MVQEGPTNGNGDPTGGNGQSAYKEDDLYSNGNGNRPSGGVRVLEPLRRTAQRLGVTVRRMDVGQPKRGKPDWLEGEKERYRLMFTGGLDHSPYPPSEGVTEVKEAIANHLNKTLQPAVPYNPEDVVPMPGSGKAWRKVGRHLVQTFGKRNLISQIPTYGSNVALWIQIQQGNFLPVPTSFASGYQTPNKAAYQDRVKYYTAAGLKPDVFLFTDPNNPTGRIHSEQEVFDIADLILEHDLTAVSDSGIYDELILNGKKQTSLAVHKDVQMNNLVILGSLSKVGDLAGDGAGWLATKNKELRKAVIFDDGLSMGGSLTGQAYTIAYLEGDTAEYERQGRQRYREAIEELYRLLANNPNIVLGPPPEGGFYATAVLRTDDGEPMDALSVSDYLLREIPASHPNPVHTTTAITPMEVAGFYGIESEGRGDEIRFALVEDPELIGDGVEALIAGIEAFQHSHGDQPIPQDRIRSTAAR